MRLVCLFFFVCSMTISAWAQFGMRVGVTSIHTSFDDRNYTDVGSELAVHYWMRLKNYRIEFLPEFILTNYKKSDFRYVQDVTFDFLRVSFGVPIRVYPFDLSSDCDCPTFSKQNDLLQKGFFFMLEPLVHYSKTNNLGFRDEDWPGIPDVVGLWHPSFGLGIGLGLDIGLSDLITLTPNLQIRPRLTDDNEFWAKPANEVNISLTATFRPDY